MTSAEGLTSMKTIYFLGSKTVGSAALTYLTTHANELGVKVIGVLSNARSLTGHEKTVVDIAQAHSIPVLSELDMLLTAPAADYILSVQYHEILKSAHIAKAKTLAVNLHMAPVPEYRGCNQFSFAVLNGDTTFGTTLHTLSVGIDSGDVIFEDRFDISQNITAKELHAQTEQKSIALFTNKIAHILSGNYQATSQKELAKTRKQGFHLRNEINTIKQIDLNWPDTKIDAHFRATFFPPFPGPFVEINGVKHYLSQNWRQEITELRNN